MLDAQRRAGAGRRGGRDLHRRGRGGARLSEPAGADGGALRAPIRFGARARRADVPDRRPGALACRTATIEFLGRNDHQVKIRGFRIELGEIEARLRAHPAGARGGGGRARGRAGREAPGGVCTRARTESDAPSARARCARIWQRELPEYMVPGGVRAAGALPLTPNGKLDRKALPAPEARRCARRAYEAPRGEIEETLAAIWAGAAGVERVGRHDNFFELGGHSLLAVQLIERLRRAGPGAEVRDAVRRADAGASWRRRWAADAQTRWRCRPTRFRRTASAITPADAAAGRADAGARSSGSCARCRAARRTSRTSIRWRRCRKASCSITCWPARAIRICWSASWPSTARRGWIAIWRALQAVIDRHDILRTAVLWEGLPRAGAGGVARGARCRSRRWSSTADGAGAASSCARCSIRGSTGST